MKLRRRKPPISIKVNKLQLAAHNRFNINYLGTPNFNKRWNLVRDQEVGNSNPLSPTKSFQPLTINFWLASLSGVVDFEAAQASDDQ
jgi:hypothetical protein